MATLTMRPYRGEVDLDAIAHLLKACEAVDPPDEWPSASDIKMQLRAPLVDKERDLCLWEDSDSKLMACGGLTIVESSKVLDSFLWFRVHPLARVGELQREIIAWGEERVWEVAQERSLSAKLLAGAHGDRVERITLLENCGFQIERYFITMVRSLVEPIPEPQLPEGFTLRHLKGEQDAQAWVEMFNETFVDHWNYHPETIETFNHRLTNPQFRLELSLIALAPGGTFAAFCDGYLASQNDRHNGHNCGLINALGTRRGFRNRGLARAMVHAVMQRLKAEGMDTVRLYVDAQNPLGALRLYESLGFRKVSTQIAYLKQI